MFWPADLVIPEFLKARVLTWGYDADLVVQFGHGSRTSLFQQAETLLGDIADSRITTEQKKRPIIFIAHSLGGLIVKDALGQATTTAITYHREIKPNVKAIMFLGTPHHGSETARVAEVVYNVYKVVTDQPDNNLLAALSNRTSDIERISSTFAALLEERNFEIHSFRGDHAVKAVIVVDGKSAIIGTGLEGKGALNASHIDMIKYAGVNDPNYKRVRGVLKRWMGMIDTIGET